MYSLGVFGNRIGPGKTQILFEYCIFRAVAGCGTRSDCAVNDYRLRQLSPTCRRLAISPFYVANTIDTGLPGGKSVRLS